jgi:hypothetical protein
MSIQDKIDNFLNEDEEIFDGDDFFDDSEVMDKMFEFITNLEDLPEEKAIQVLEIINHIAPEEIEEGMAAKRVKIKPADKRKRKREYRKKKAQLKMKARRFRRTAKFKKYSRMKKRKARSGKTASGKRIRKFI